MGGDAGGGVKAILRKLYTDLNLFDRLSPIIPGVYYRSCNFCGSLALKRFAYGGGSREYRYLFPKKIYGDRAISRPGLMKLLELRYVKCEQCGLVYISPLPDFKDISVHVFDGEQNIVAWSASDWASYRKNKEDFYSDFYEQLNLEAYRQKNQVLDVSCGPGVTLNWLKSQGWHVRGIDPDRHSRRRAKELFGIDIQSGLIADLHDEPGTYDLINFDNALEHHFNPLEALVVAYRLLRNGGRLCIVVPNAEGLSTMYCGENMNWGHWFSFSVRCLATILHKIGFEVTGVIADQGGIVPEKVRPFVDESFNWGESLQNRILGPDTLANVQVGTFSSDYIALIADKPLAGPVVSASEEELLAVGRSSLIQRKCIWSLLP
jgi:SAM-dependent methyltransferase